MVNMNRYIKRDDVYALFDKSGMANLHVADIDVIQDADVVPAPNYRVPSKEEWMERYCTKKQLAGYEKRKGDTDND